MEQISIYRSRFWSWSTLSPVVEGNSLMDTATNLYQWTFPTGMKNTFKLLKVGLSQFSLSSETKDFCSLQPVQGEKTFCSATNVWAPLYTRAYAPSHLKYMTYVIVWNIPTAKDSSMYFVYNTYITRCGFPRKDTRSRWKQNTQLL